MTNFHNKKILIIGGAGFVGSNLAHTLVHDNPKNITIVDNLLSAETINIPTDNCVQFVEGSISDDRVILNLPKDYDYIFHLATYHGNQSSIASPIKDHENNTLTSLKLFDYYKDASNLKACVYSSAGCTVAKKTYDDVKATDEEAPVSLYLDSPYQISKIIGEFYGNYYFKLYNFPFIKARFQNVFGPREILGAGSYRGTANTVWRNVIPSFIFKALTNQALPLDNEGKATRDFIFVDDIVSGLIKCALNGTAGEVYNLASGKEISIKHLAETINKFANNKAGIELKPARNWDNSGKRFGDTLKAKETIGFECNYQFEDGLEKTINWTKDNFSTILSTMLQHKYYVPELAQFESLLNA